MIVISVAVVLAKFLISLKKEPEKKEIIKTPPTVKVIIAEPVSKVMTVEAYGTVKPGKAVKITAEVSGRIDYIHPHFIEGGQIDKGQVLIQIDQRSYTLNRQAGKVRIRQARTDIAKLKQDIANLKNDIQLAMANLRLVEKEFKRIRALSNSQFASKNSLDRAEQQYLQAKIQLQNLNNRLSLTDTLMEQRLTALAMAKVDFQKADLAFEKTRILSDFNGFVLHKYAETGEYINPGQLIGITYQKDNLEVDVRIPLEKLKWVESFFENGKMPAAEVTMAKPDKMGSTVWDAKVARIKAKIDETTRTLPMTLEIVQPEKRVKKIFDLKPGAFVKCSIKGKTIDNVFVLPRHIVKQDDIIYKVNTGNLKMKKVRVLRKFEDEIYIDSGLEPGDRIIVSPLPGAFEGMAVMIKQDGN